MSNTTFVCITTNSAEKPGFQTMLNPTHIYTVKKGCENRIFGFPQKYHVKTTQDTTQVTFRVFQAKLGPVNF